MSDKYPNESPRHIEQDRAARTWTTLEMSKIGDQRRRGCLPIDLCMIAVVMVIVLIVVVAVMP